MTPQTKDSIGAVGFGTAILLLAIWGMPDASPFVYIAIWVICCLGAFKGAVDWRAKRRAAYEGEHKAG